MATMYSTTRPLMLLREMLPGILLHCPLELLCFWWVCRDVAFGGRSPAFPSPPLPQIATGAEGLQVQVLAEPVRTQVPTDPPRQDLTSAGPQFARTQGPTELVKT